MRSNFFPLAPRRFLFGLSLFALFSLVVLPGIGHAQDTEPVTQIPATEGEASPASAESSREARIERNGSEEEQPAESPEVDAQVAPTPSSMDEPASLGDPLEHRTSVVEMAEEPAAERADGEEQAEGVTESASPCGDAYRCPALIGLGAHAGFSLNVDQWMVGGHFRLGARCIPSVRLVPKIEFGFAGNWFSTRLGAHLEFTHRFGGHHGLGIGLIVGTVFQHTRSVGRFHEFCNETGLDQCSEINFGWQVGGTVRFRNFGIEAFANLGTGLPVLIVALSTSFTVIGESPEDL